jgi:hypothetical protein
MSAYPAGERYVAHSDHASFVFRSAVRGWNGETAVIAAAIYRDVAVR